MAADKWAGTGQKLAQADGSRKETLFDRASGRIRRPTMRPAPLWVGRRAGSALPVSRNRPGLGSASIARRTRSQTAGYSCHSSMRDRRFRIHQLLWGCSQELSDGGLVEKKGGPSAPRARGGLPDASRPFESDGRQSGEKFVELRVNETWVIARSAARTLGCGHRPLKTLGADKDTVLRYHSHGFYDTFRTDPTLLIAQQPDREELGLSLGVDARLAVSTIAREPSQKARLGPPRIRIRTRALARQRSGVRIPSAPPPASRRSSHERAPIAGLEVELAYPLPSASAARPSSTRSRPNA